MIINQVIAQLRTTDLEKSIDFYVNRLGFVLEFRFDDFYAGIQVAEDQGFHLKLVDEPDASIDQVASGHHFHLFLTTPDVDRWAEHLQQNNIEFLIDLHNTVWGTREFYIRDNQGHVICFSASTD